MELCKTNECTGCTACYSICPKSAIEMKRNEQGFLYPVINQSKCISCNACTKVCESLNHYMDNKKELAVQTYACRNEAVLSTSQSGGVGYTLAKKIIESGGVVYGCVYDSNLKVEHTRLSSLDELYRIQGSKYLQSNMKDCYKGVIDDLKAGLTVLFTGTPCQVAGLETLLEFKRINTDRFYSCDLICHGVPSPQIYEDYLAYMEKKFQSKITSINLRDKSVEGWHQHIESVNFENGQRFTGKIYTRLFYSNLALRKSCENCKYTNMVRPSDITIADCWGFEKINDQKWTDNRGISVAILQTEHGKELFDLVKDQMELYELNLTDYNQPQLHHSSPTPYQKDNFWKDYSKGGFDLIIKKYTVEGGIPFKIKRKILKFLKKW